MLKINELFKRCLWSVLFVAIYVCGQQIVLPVVDPTTAANYLQQNTFLQSIGAATGGQLQIPALFTLGIAPFMTSTIVWQAVAALDLQVINNLPQRVVGIIQNGISAVFAVLQALLYVYYIKDSLIPVYLPGFGTDVSFQAGVLFLTAGAMLAIALGNANMKRGVGGQVVLILPGILTTLPRMLYRGWGLAKFVLTPSHLLIAAIVTLMFIPVAVAINQAELHVPLERPMLDSKFSDSYLPIRLLSAGPMPFMFSAMMFTLPQTLLSGSSVGDTTVGQLIVSWTTYTHVSGIVTYGVIVMLLTYAFGLLNFQPSKTAKGLKESGDYFLNVPPGDQTERHLVRLFNRMTFPGGLVLLAIGITPLIIGLKWRGAANFSPYLGNVFILVTIIDTVAQQFRALYTKNQYQLFTPLRGRRYR